MKKALELAARGKGWVSPNPMVGAVIVKNNIIIGEGYHQRYGDIHAEVAALNSAGSLAKDGTLYVNLEPCAHFGKTPPCTEAIISAGISKVNIAIADPNPIVLGKGIAQLKKSGITVNVGLLQEAAEKLNEIFIKNITTQRPFIAIKIASTLDGKIATETRSSKWITSSAARDYVHALRHEYDAVLVGINTVLQDNPLLNCRLDEPKRDPVRIVIDSKLQIPLNAAIIKASRTASLIVFTRSSDNQKIYELQKLGVTVVLEDGLGRISPEFIIDKLSEMKITSILIEGGAEIAWSFIKEDLADKFYTFLAPKLVGGFDAVPITRGEGIKEMQDAKRVKWDEVTFIGDDILITSYKS